MLAITDPEDAYELHVNLITHGRRVCRPAAALRRVRPAPDVPMVPRTHRASGAGAGRFPAAMSKRPFVVFGIFAADLRRRDPLDRPRQEGRSGRRDGQGRLARTSRPQGLFATNCGPCHTLAAAGTDGVVGPNLDQLLVPSGTNSAESYQANAGRVMHAVICGVEGRMPKGILEEEEAKQVATFVAAYAGQIGKGPVRRHRRASQAASSPPASCG